MLMLVFHYGEGVQITLPKNLISLSKLDGEERCDLAQSDQESPRSSQICIFL